MPGRRYFVGPDALNIRIVFVIFAEITIEKHRKKERIQW